MDTRVWKFIAFALAILVFIGGFVLLMCGPVTCYRKAMLKERGFISIEQKKNTVKQQ